MEFWPLLKGKRMSDHHGFNLFKFIPFLWLGFFLCNTNGLMVSPGVAQCHFKICFIHGKHPGWHPVVR